MSETLELRLITDLRDLESNRIYLVEDTKYHRYGIAEHASDGYLYFVEDYRLPHIHATDPGIKIWVLPKHK